MIKRRFFNGMCTEVSSLMASVVFLDSLFSQGLITANTFLAFCCGMMGTSLGSSVILADAGTA